jgi:hypothetical protein
MRARSSALYAMQSASTVVGASVQGVVWKDGRASMQGVRINLRARSQRSKCKECGGSSAAGEICEHGRQRYNCKECGGKGICEHGRRRYGCKECKK